MYLVVNPEFSKFGGLKSWRSEILPLQIEKCETQLMTECCFTHKRNLLKDKLLGKSKHIALFEPTPCVIIGQELFSCASPIAKRSKLDTTEVNDRVVISHAKGVLV